ncbi:hypothetical protein D3C71_77060 [compost metagenome]
MTAEFLTMLFWLLVGHAICDYPLQGDFLSQAKNRFTPVGKPIWRHALMAHGLIHGGAVALVTGFVFLGLLEVIVHIVTDHCKNKGLLTFAQDQWIHYGCKVAWALPATLVIHLNRT